MLSDIFRNVLNNEYTHTDDWVSCTHEVHGGVLYIYFEWSNGAADWRKNFNFPAVPYRDMPDRWYCHRGFLRAWKSVEEVLREQIMSPEIHTIRIAGYSHGAALALLCHEYCCYHRPECIVLGYGFGCPRVIWGRLPRVVKDRLRGFLVIRNKGDIVTHLPPAFLGYRHSSTVLKIGGHEHYGMIDAHRPESYIVELERSEQL